MFDDTNCPKCNKKITNDAAVDQDIDIPGAMAAAEVHMLCPHCNIRLKVDVEMYWSLSVAEYQFRSSSSKAIK